MTAKPGEARLLALVLLPAHWSFFLLQFGERSPL
jgi:hypothetical protein